MIAAISRFKQSLRDALRSAVWLTIGALFMLVALAFLTAALWLLIARADDALIATTVVGALYFVLAVVLLALGARGGRKEAAETTAAEAEAEFKRQPLVQIAEGFAVGMQAGRAARSRD